MVMLIVSFITNANERWMAITKVQSVLLSIKMSTQRQSYTLEFKLKAIGKVKKGKKKDVCREYKIAPSILATFLKNEKQLVSAKESQKLHAKTKKMRRDNHGSVDAAVFL